MTVFRLTPTSLDAFCFSLVLFESKPRWRLLNQQIRMSSLAATENRHYTAMPACKWFVNFMKLTNPTTIDSVPYCHNVNSRFSPVVIKTKNRNHSMNKVKNLGYDRRLIHKQPRQESGLCCFSFASYLRKCVTQIYGALYGDAMFVPFGGAQTWRP